MPARGKHRRPRNSALTRGFVAAGAGGAALALPLTFATGVHAAERTAPAAAPAPAKAAAAPQKAALAESRAQAPAVHRVVPGEHLSKIAEERRIDGGWQRLYQDNREAVGDDPSLIHPGLELALDAPSPSSADGAKGSGSPRAPRASQPAQKAPAEAPAPAAPAAKKAAPAQPAAPEAPAPAPEAPAPAPSAPAPEAAPETPAAPEAAASGYTTPLASAGVTTGYRVSGAMWSSGYHTGIDFAVATGTSVRSIGPGAVVSAGWNGAYGNEVVIRHADGTHSQYAHLSSLSVSAGQSVSGGTQIGLSGSTGNSSGPHLHFEIRTGAGYGSDVDPVEYLRRHGVSL